eukprot:6469242-Amphidinium_carterae.1
MGLEVLRIVRNYHAQLYTTTPSCWLEWVACGLLGWNAQCAVLVLMSFRVKPWGRILRKRLMELHLKKMGMEKEGSCMTLLEVPTFNFQSARWCHTA